MISKRMKELLVKAATCFDDGYSPFNDQWLSEHNVTLDECMDLSSMIGTVLSGVAHASDMTQQEIIIVGASKGVITSENARASIHVVRTRNK